MDLQFKAQLGEVLAGRPQSEKFVEGLNQDFKEGEFVTLASGLVTYDASDPTLVLGLARADSHNHASVYYPCEVLVANARTTFIMQIYNSDSGNVTLAQAHIGASYGITPSSGIWYVDEHKTSTSARVKIVKPFDPIGTVNGRVYVQVLAAQREFD